MSNNSDDYITEMALSAALKNMAREIRGNTNNEEDPHLFAHMTRTSGQLTPISHPTLEGMYRVVMMRQPFPTMKYVMFVGDGFVRVFNDETLPDDLRFKMMAIDTYAEGHNRNAPPDFIHTVPPPLNEVYKNSLGEAMDDIGWRSHEYYCFVMSYEELLAYRGGDNGTPVAEYKFVTAHNKEARTRSRL